MDIGVIGHKPCFTSSKSSELPMSVMAYSQIWYACIYLTSMCALSSSLLGIGSSMLYTNCVDFKPVGAELFYVVLVLLRLLVSQVSSGLELLLSVGCLATDFHSCTLIDLIIHSLLFKTFMYRRSLFHPHTYPAFAIIPLYPLQSRHCKLDLMPLFPEQQEVNQSIIFQ